MAEVRDSDSIKIVKTGTGAKGSLVKSAMTAPVADGNWAPKQARALRDFDDRLNEVHDRLLGCWENDEEPAFIDLEAELGRDLWLHVLYFAAALHSAVDYRFPGAPQQFRALFEGESEVVLTWELVKNNTLALVLLRVGGVDGECVAISKWKFFFSDVIWETVPNRWLLHELGTTPQQIRSTLHRVLP